LTAQHYVPTPQIPTIAATSVAINIANIAIERASVPSIAMLVSVAKIPPAGVKPPYMSAWKAAAREPIGTNVSAPSASDHGLNTWNDTLGAEAKTQ
jgi:hypothetical protein